MEFSLALITFTGAAVGAIITAGVAIFISRHDAKMKEKAIKEQEIKKRKDIINDIDSEIELNIYNAKKIKEIDLPNGMVARNPEETCEDCYNIIDKLEELEKEVRYIIKPLKSIDSRSKEINDDMVWLVKLIDKRRITFKNMTRMYRNRLIKGMKIDESMSEIDQDKNVKDNLLASKKNVNKDLENYIQELEEFRNKYLN